ncbi:MAG: hypothetical protein HZB16_22975, partial [Armatimonadetes bacterium]|nr:hypothetical protein [Armatimonadota bacterium]
MRARAKFRGLSVGAAVLLAVLVGVVAGDQREAAPHWMLARRSSSPAPATLRVAQPVVLSTAQGRARTGRAAVYTVTTTADSGVGSLRDALVSANTSAGLDTIEFGIPGSGPYIIT